MISGAILGSLLLWRFRKQYPTFQPKTLQTIMCVVCGEKFEFEITKQIRGVGQNVACPRCTTVLFVYPGGEIVDPRDNHEKNRMVYLSGHGSKWS